MVVLTYLFTDFFTVERLVRDPFRTSSQNGGRIFCLSLQLSGRGSTVVFTLSRLLAKLLSNLLTFPYFCPESEWGHNRFRWFPICADLGSPVFSLTFLITVVILLWRGDLQRVLWSDSLRSAGRRLYSLSAFSSCFLLSLLSHEFPLYLGPITQRLFRFLYPFTTLLI